MGQKGSEVMFEIFLLPCMYLLFSLVCLSVCLSVCLFFAVTGMKATGLWKRCTLTM